MARTGSSFWRSPKVGRLIPMAALLALSLVLVALHVRAYHKLSPFDELQHIDYLYKVSSGHLVHNGEHVGTQAMNEEACRGIDASFAPPPCGATYSPSQFQEMGVNTAEAHSPTYYVVTAIGARLLLATHAVNNLVTAGRLVGALWLAAGLIGFWLVAGLLGAGVAARASVAGLLATNAWLLHASATINPDATALVAGAVVVLAALLWEDGRAPVWLLPAVAALATLFKATNLIGVIAVVLYFVLRAVVRRYAPDSSPLRSGAYLIGAALLSVGAIVAEAAWLVVRSAIAIPNHPLDPMSARFHVNSLPLHNVFDQIPSFVTFVFVPNLPTFATRWYSVVLWQLLNALLLGAALGALLYAVRFLRLEALAASGSIMLFAGAPFLVLAVYVTQHTYTIIPGRYVLSLLPVLGAILAASLRTRWTLIPVAAFGAISLLVTLVALVRFPLP